MEYSFLLLGFAGGTAFGALVLIYWAYVLLLRSESKEERGKLLLGGVLVVFLAAPCSFVAFVGHGFIDVASNLDWIKAGISWTGVPLLFYYLVYHLARYFRFFKAYSKPWAMLACSGVLTTWAFEAWMMYELSNMS